MTVSQGPWAEAGNWMASMRQSLEITAGELAEQADAPSRQWVLDVEAGRRAVSSAMYSSLARIYGLPVQGFAASCLRYYDNKAFEALFCDVPEPVAVAA